MIEMTKKILIVLMALGLASCASQAPLDDAYYWPDKEHKHEKEKIEYLNVQDTTVTIRVNK